MYSPTQAYQPGSGLDSTTALLIGMKEKGTLQSYVAAHQGKPEYPQLLALATSINNISSAEQAAKYQPPQQTVAEQRLAALAPQQPQGMPQDMPQSAGAPLPEEQGIGQLPARNLEKMADGGIAGYAGGGMNPDGQLAYNNEPVVRMAGGGIVAFADGGDTGGYFDPNTGEFIINEQRDTRSFGQKVADAFGYKKGLNINPAGGIPKAPTPALQGTQNARDALLAQGQTSGANLVQQAAAPTSTQPPVTAPKPDTGNAGIAALTSGAGSTGGAGGYEKRFADLFSKDDVSKADRMKEISDIDKPVLDKMKETIEENKSKLKSDREENFYMSLIQGGLAAAGGSSQYALQNIAQGFEKGASNFNEGIKDLRKAAQENTKMEMAMSQYEASGKKDALKSYYDHQDKMQALKAQGYATIMGHEISKEGQIAAAGAGANAQRNLMEALGNAPEGSALRRGFEMTKQEGRVPAMYDAYVKAATDPMKGDDFRRMYPDFQTYLAGMGGSNAGKFINIPNSGAVNAPVLQRKN